MSAMRPEPILSESADADRKRRWWILAAAVTLPATLMLMGSLGHPLWGFAVIAVVFPMLWFIGQRHNKRTREGTDERAQHLHRQASAFSWQIVAVVLAGTMIWMNVRHGIKAAEPYLALTIVMLASYVLPRLWLQWRER